jgi:hypothetical protein
LGKAGFVNVIECFPHGNDHILAIACVIPDIFFPLQIVAPRPMNLSQDGGSNRTGECMALPVPVLKDLDAFVCHVGKAYL